MIPLPLDAVTRVIISDVHGDHVALKILLQKIGVLDSRGARNEGFFVAQLGDLVHLGHGVHDDDAITLDLSRNWIDLQILGNHELYYCFGLESGLFAGINSANTLHPAIPGLLAELKHSGRLHPAAAIDGWLLTHAGLHPCYQDELPKALLSDAAGLAEELESRFVERLNDGESCLFDAVGPRRSGGRDERPGGIFWMDFSELEEIIGNNRVRQIVGHTPQLKPRQLANVWVNDVGAALSGKLSALVKAGPGGDWDVVVISRRPIET